MHELSLVEQLVDECAARAAGAAVSHVRVRHSSTLPEETLRQAFDMLTESGPLAGAVLETEVAEERLDCTCGFSGVLGHHDVVGPAVVCPQCGEVWPRSERTELALLEVRLAQYMTGG